MPTPNLLNPVNVIVEKADKSGVGQDHLRREPVNRIVRTVRFTIEAQVSWYDQVDMVPGAAGTVDNDSGYIMVRTMDREKLGETIARGDRIIKIGKRTVALFVTDFSLHSHYNGDFQLEQYDFADRTSNDG